MKKRNYERSILFLCSEQAWEKENMKEYSLCVCVRFCVCLFVCFCLVCQPSRVRLFRMFSFAYNIHLSLRRPLETDKATIILSY